MMPSRPPLLTTEDGTPYEVPVEGSLGLLALGYAGLILWREARKEQAYDFAQHLLPPEPQTKKGE